MSKANKPCPACGGAVKLESHYSRVYEEIRGLVNCPACGLLRWFKGVSVYGISSSDKARIKKCHAKAKKMAAEKWNAEVTI